MPSVLPQYPFRLHVEPFYGEGLVVAEFEGREALSRPYAFDLLALTPNPLALEDLPALGTPCSFVTQGNQYEDGAPRRVHGVLSRVTLQATAHDRGGTWLRARLVPRLWKLRRRRARRIFQDRNVLQIVDVIFGEHGVPWKFLVDSELPPMAYCVQYDETDYAFVHRLLARFGLLYFFVHAEVDPGSPEAVETVVVCDAARHYAALAWPGVREPRVLKLVDRTGTYRPDEAVMRFAFERRAEPTAARLRDWDFRAPAYPGEFAQASDAEPGLGTGTLVADEFENRGGNDLIRTTRRDARTALEQNRAGAVRGRGASDCLAFSPGYRWVLNNHDVAHLNVAWVLTAVEHEGRVPELARGTAERPAGPQPDAMYHNRFVCAPADVTVRPARPPRVLRQVTETAAVVGPEGEEIYTDEFGRIKVQFRWDRDGRYNEASSCWLRVAQAWAGAGWGFQFIPRIGMEVLVTFVGGDTDHPVVTGCLYNAARPPSHPLPASKTRSGIRTQTTPGGDPARSNEIAFEDAAGDELFYMHAQKDLREVVRNNHHEWVGANQNTQVGADRQDSVGNDEIRRVGHSRFALVEAGSLDEVKGMRREITGQNSEYKTDGSSSVRVGENLEVTVGGTERRTTRGPADVAYDDDKTERVRGHHTMLVGGPHAKRSNIMYTEGVVELVGTDVVEINSNHEVLLRCGRSAIRLAPDRIEISSPLVTLGAAGAGVKVGEDEVRVRTEERVVVLSDKILLRSESANVALGTDAQIDGNKVLLNSPAMASESVTDETPQPATVSLSSSNGAPMAHQPYRVVASDGTEHTGFLGADGSAQIDVPPGAHITFPELGDWKPAG